MATTLEQYYQMRQQLDGRIAAGKIDTPKLLGYQELLYRISVLESCMNFIKTTPVSTDLKILGEHYKVVEAFFTSLTQERQFGLPADERLRNQRATALSNLQTVVNCFRKQFQSYNAQSAEVYRESITKMVNTILPAWLQYRYTYIPF